MNEFAPDNSEKAKKPGLLRRLAARGLGSTVEKPAETSVDPEAPLGYIEGTDIPKKVSRVHVIDPEGKKPTHSYNVRNW